MIPPRYERVFGPRPGGGDGARVIFCVERAALTGGDEAVALAAGLARTLDDHGWEARLVTEPDWRTISPDVDVVVGCSPRFAPATAPGGPVVLGWATDVRGFAARTDLGAYDGLLAPSRLAADHLAQAFAGPVTVLPPAVDPGLFPSGDAVNARRGTLDAAVLDPTPLVNALRRLGGAVAARCPASAGHREFGVVPLPLLHAAMAGALPVATSRLGLADLGLDDVEAGTDPAASAGLLTAAARQPGASAARAQRLRATIRAGHTWRQRVAVFQAAVDDAQEARQRIPATVGYFPDYPENPYQRMLYAHAAATGVRVVPLADPARFPAVRDDGKDLDRHVLHIQWTAPLLQVASGPLDATRRLEAFKESVARFRDRGGRLLWTVHNVLPHEMRFRMAELELAEFLARSADRIHVLGEETIAAAAPFYRLPAEKVVVIPHASYLDVYPDCIGTEEARRRLGLLDGEIGILLFGVIRPYKGLDTLLDAFDRVLAADPRLRLLVAGRPSASPRVDIWRQRCAEHPRIVSALRYIEPAEVQLWLRACDLVVLPYQAVLNSGALHLALAFGRPVIAPAVGVVAAQVEPAFASTFAPGDDDDMVRAIGDAVTRLTTPEAGAAALAAAERWGPAQMSQAFYELLESLIPGIAPAR